MIRELLREYIRALLETGPIAQSDGLGMVNFTRPTADPDHVEAEFDHNNFSGIARRAYKSARTTNDKINTSDLADRISMRNRKIMGIETDEEDLEHELQNAAVEDEEFNASTPEEKVRYYADPKWYTRYF